MRQAQTNLRWLSHTAGTVIRRTGDGSSPEGRIKCIICTSVLNAVTCPLHTGSSPYRCCVRVRQSVGEGVRAEAGERDSQTQQAQEKCHPWRILGNIISKVGHRLPDTHHQISHTPGM